MDELEQAALDDAYAAHIGDLFKTLVRSLVTGEETDEYEQGCVDRFVVGLSKARRAMELAKSAL